MQATPTRDPTITKRNAIALLLLLFVLLGSGFGFVPGLLGGLVGEPADGGGQPAPDAPPAATTTTTANPATDSTTAAAPGATTSVPDETTTAAATTTATTAAPTATTDSAFKPWLYTVTPVPQDRPHVALSGDGNASVESADQSPSDTRVGNASTTAAVGE